MKIPQFFIKIQNWTLTISIKLYSHDHLQYSPNVSLHLHPTISVFKILSKACEIRNKKSRRHGEKLNWKKKIQPCRHQKGSQKFHLKSVKRLSINFLKFKFPSASNLLTSLRVLAKWNLRCGTWRQSKRKWDCVGERRTSLGINLSHCQLPCMQFSP